MSIRRCSYSFYYAKGRCVWGPGRKNGRSDGIPITISLGRTYSRTYRRRTARGNPGIKYSDLCNARPNYGGGCDIRLVFHYRFGGRRKHDPSPCTRVRRPPRVKCTRCRDRPTEIMHVLRLPKHGRDVTVRSLREMGEK